MAFTKSNSKMISIKSRGTVHTSRGIHRSPIRTPYREYIDKIWSIITVDRAEVYEHIGDYEIKLTPQNYDQDNTPPVKKKPTPKPEPVIIEEPKPKIIEESKPIPTPQHPKKKNKNHNKPFIIEQSKPEDVSMPVGEPKIEEVPVQATEANADSISDEELEALTAPKVENESLEVPVDEL